MPYIDLREQKQGRVRIKKIRKNMARFTEKEIRKAKLCRKMQGQVGHPPGGVFKQMIGEKALKITPLNSMMSLTPLPFVVLMSTD